MCAVLMCHTLIFSILTRQRGVPESHCPLPLVLRRRLGTSPPRFRSKKAQLTRFRYTILVLIYHTFIYHTFSRTMYVRFSCTVLLHVPYSLDRGEFLISTALFLSSYAGDSVPHHPAIARRGNNLQGYQDFYLKSKARIWP